MPKVKYMKDIAGFDNYSILSDGTVFSHLRNRPLKAKKHSQGYLAISLGRGNQKLIHRIVAEAFIENPLALPFVNHKNGNKTDNRVENLEWVNNSQNLLHSVKIGTYNHARKVSDNYLKKVSREDIREMISMRGRGERLVSIAEKFGISHPMVSRYCRGMFQNNISHA